MAFTLNSYVEAVRGRLQEVEESTEIIVDDIEDSIMIAVRLHSEARPLEKVADLAGDGNYDLALPDDWVKDFSTIISIEYPQGNRTPTYLEPKETMLYQGTSGNPVLRFLSVTPQSGETVRITYTVPHTVTDTTSTIPDDDFWAVANLAAALTARVLAARYTRVWEPTLDIDLINYSRKADDYRALADQCELIWRRHLGLPDEGGPIPALSYSDWDMMFSWNRSLLVHKPSLR